MSKPIRLEKKYKLLRKTEENHVEHPTVGFGWSRDVVSQSFDSEDDAIQHCLDMDIYDVYIVPYISPVWY